jgi:phosphatidylethanolamine-binding protein (PEBP) family uncharacterized protein
MAFAIKSPAFAQGAPVPKQFTCDGNDAPPPIKVSDPPEGTRSFAVIMEDPDAPKGTFTHWLAYDIPAGKTDLQVDAAKTLRNSFGREGTADPALRLVMDLTATCSRCMRSTSPHSPLRERPSRTWKRPWRRTH